MLNAQFALATHLDPPDLLRFSYAPMEFDSDDQVTDSEWCVTLEDNTGISSVEVFASKLEEFAHASEFGSLVIPTQEADIPVTVCRSDILFFLDGAIITTNIPRGTYGLWVRLLDSDGNEIFYGNPAAIAFLLGDGDLCALGPCQIVNRSGPPEELPSLGLHLPGDMNFDQAVEILDSVLLRRMLAGLPVE